MSRDKISKEQWLTAWQAFDELYTPHSAELQALIVSRAGQLEQSYDALDDLEERERERFISHCYDWAKQYGLPSVLVDWWRTLQVKWMTSEERGCLPDELPYQHQRLVMWMESILRMFRQSLAEDKQEDAMFLAAMAEAIRLAEAQRHLQTI